MDNGNDLIREIDNVVGSIAVHPEYSDRLRNKLMKDLRTDADKHSTEIEIDENKKEVSLSRTKIRENVLTNLDDARKFLSLEGINAYSLSQLGSLVAPKTNDKKNFRTTEAKFGGFAAPGPLDIHPQIEGLLLDLNDPNIHPVIKAIGAHIGIVQIHPYKDGNGRVARLLQNHVLEQRAYPPVVIPTSERKLYFGLMNDVLADRYTNESSLLDPSRAEILFNNYIEAKVLDSAHNLEDMLRKRRVYDVEVTGIKGEKGVAHKVKNILAASLQRDPSREPVSLGKMVFENHKSFHLTVTGDVGADDISRVLKREAEKYNLGFNIGSRKYCDGDK